MAVNPASATWTLWPVPANYLRDTREKKGTYHLLGNCWDMAERTKPGEVSLHLCLLGGESERGRVRAEPCCGSPAAQPAPLPSPASSLPCPSLPAFLSSSFILAFYCIFPFYARKNVLHFFSSFNENQKFLKLERKVTYNRRGKTLRIPDSPFLEIRKSCLDTVLPEWCAQEMPLQQGAGLEELQCSLPVWTILWFHAQNEQKNQTIRWVLITTGFE